jgi:hypothetical protein
MQVCEEASDLDADQFGPELKAWMLLTGKGF